MPGIPLRRRLRRVARPAGRYGPPGVERRPGVDAARPRRAVGCLGPGGARDPPHPPALGPDRGQGSRPADLAGGGSSRPATRPIWPSWPIRPDGHCLVDRARPRIGAVAAVSIAHAEGSRSPSRPATAGPGRHRRGAGLDRPRPGSRPLPSPRRNVPCWHHGWAKTRREWIARSARGQAGGRQGGRDRTRGGTGPRLRLWPWTRRRAWRESSSASARPPRAGNSRGRFSWCGPIDAVSMSGRGPWARGLKDDDRRHFRCRLARGAEGPLPRGPRGRSGPAQSTGRLASSPTSAWRRSMPWCSGKRSRATSAGRSRSTASWPISAAAGSSATSPSPS